MTFKNFIKRLKGIFLIFGVLSIILIFLFSLISKNCNTKNEINIAISDDFSGLVIDYLINNRKDNNLKIKKELKSHKIVDCCSNTLSMGLASKSLDMALMCPYSAKNLIVKDNKFEVLGPCILNSNAFILSSKNIKSIGISDGREYEKEEIYKRFGKDKKIISMLNPSLPYSLEKGNVQGILIDSLKGILLQNKNYKILPLEGPTYVLVVSKIFKKDKRFKMFLNEFNDSLNKLNNFKILTTEIERFKNINFSREELENWKKLKIKFLPIILKEN